ncbi:MAG: hypothetical protein Q7R83_02350 [bacterium]|nr:hypothetical protein [bacterium]
MSESEKFNKPPSEEKIQDIIDAPPGWRLDRFIHLMLDHAVASKKVVTGRFNGVIFNVDATSDDTPDVREKKFEQIKTEVLASAPKWEKGV